MNEELTISFVSSKGIQRKSLKGEREKKSHILSPQPPSLSHPPTMMDHKVVAFFIAAKKPRHRNN